MATRYADFDLGTGDNDGTSWANAWQTMADAVAGTNSSVPAAGERVYCRGTDSMGAAGGSADTVTSALNGDTTSGFILWIGVNGDGNNDGTRTVMDADALADNKDCLIINGDYNVYENFEFKNADGASGDGISGVGDKLVFINCSFNNNVGQGSALAATSGECAFIICTAYSNGTDGFNVGPYQRYFFCSSYDNTGSGWNCSAGSYTCLIGCLSFDNGDDGYEDSNSCAVFYNCVADDNTDDGFNIGLIDRMCMVIGCRATNHAGAGDIGIGFTYPGVYGWNHMDNNADNLSEGLAYAITNNGAATNSSVNEGGGGGGDTYAGYTNDTDNDPIAEDFNLRSDATLRRTAITIPTS